MEARRSLHQRVAAVAISTIAVQLAGLAVGVGTPTASASDQWQCGLYSCFHQWRITRVTHARLRRGGWRSCVSFAKSKHSGQATCAIEKSQSNTVTATLTGSLMVPEAQLSAAVGYDVTRSSSVTASYTASIPAHRSGVIQWAPVFTHRRKVQQRAWTCKHVPYGHVVCNKQPDRLFRYVYTEKYSHPRFRVRFRP